jgi:hypothetical protein
MKKILLLAIIICSANWVLAQCEKKIVWTANKAEFLDEAGAVQDTKEVTVVIESSGKYVKITHSDDLNDSLTGPVKELKCGWSEPYKNGKLEYKCDLSERSGDMANSVMTVEAKDSKIIIYLHIETPDGKKMTIRIPVENYKEST